MQAREGNPAGLSIDEVISSFDLATKDGTNELDLDKIGLSFNSDGYTPAGSTTAAAAAAGSQSTAASFEGPYENISDEVQYFSGTSEALSASTVNTVPFISSNEAGNFLVTWTEPSNNGSDIYGQISDPSGNHITSPFKINSTSDAYDQTNSISVGLPNGNHAVFWNGTDASSGGEPRSKGQILDPAGQPIGGEFSVSSGYGSDPQPLVLENGIFWSLGETKIMTALDRRRNFFGDGSALSGI